MKHVTLVHYDEIALKGGNRGFFEDALVRDIRSKLRSAGLGDAYKVRKLFGRIIIESKKSGVEDQNAIYEALSKTFGIAFFAHALRTENVLDDILDAALMITKNVQFETFGIVTRRSEKMVPFTTQEINVKVGAAVQEQSDARVYLDDPELPVHIDVTHEGTYIYTRKQPGQGGLPYGVQGKALVLVSGGIDSPVASYMMAKRGIEPVYLHFHSYPFTTDQSIEKVRGLVKILTGYTGPTDLYLHPFSELQKKIVYSVPDKYRIIIYRRMMMRIACALAKQLGIQALVTGEALGQVASQTLENMFVISDASDLPLLRPLVGYDKKDIISLAQKVGTYELSIEPHDDCCTVFMPKRPVTRAVLQDVLDVEKELPIEELVTEALGQIEKELVK